MTSPTQRSLKLLRARGYFCAIVEHWNAHIHCRMDLWGFGDILALHDDEVLIVQTTSGTNVSARLDKIRSNIAAAIWLKSPHRFIVVHGWRLVGPCGKRKVWECREVRVFPSEIKATSPP